MNEKTYDGAKKYVIPIQENTSGEKRMLFPALGNLPVHPQENVLLIYSPGMPYATLYTYLDIRSIIAWIQEEQKHLPDKNKAVFDDSVVDDSQSE